MKHLILLAYLFFLSTTALYAKTHTSLIVSGNLKRSFVVHEPNNYNPQKPHSLLIALHGRLGTGKEMSELSSFNPISDRENFIVIYPDGIKKSWNDGRGTTPASLDAIDDVRFIKDLIIYASRNLNIDKTKIFVAGMSNGAYMSFRLACELPAISGVAAVAGTMPVNYLTTCKPRKKLPVLIIHGTADIFSKYNGGNDQRGETLSVQDTFTFWAKNNSCNPKFKRKTFINTDKKDGTTVVKEEYLGCKTSLYTVLGGGHTWPSGAEYLPAKLVGKRSFDINASESIWAFFKKI